MPFLLSRESKASNYAKDTDTDVGSVCSCDIKGDNRQQPASTTREITAKSSFSSSERITPEQLAKYKKMAMRNSMRIS
ncbi:uncharacterized protein B0I36DRAFT_369883 [Microdochium trichocladiopsis]|uniref:Uncharacterized protein n=1 Tax=Microdochium trichocladiopsis TaxID=1682393 RepID=A0A9P9BID3_9PEZI|nr:uncharacterized protein B0I36DRAFT_369883 [Microdochium trichocladiopsis]KAH7012032.1 hypothetical protein B0I36DRAFT_369883 [Microdochium trichocladiopsis]